MYGEAMQGWDESVRGVRRVKPRCGFRVRARVLGLGLGLGIGIKMGIAVGIRSKDKG